MEEELGPISAALEACLEPHTSNDTRRQALDYLEQIKSKPEAPQCGLLLARDQTRPQAIRYFGLQLLEYTIRYRFDDVPSAQVEAIISSVAQLANSCQDGDPSFFRNKVAQLWVQCAERAWPEQWRDMDAALYSLWTHPRPNADVASKLLVLDILETLSTDVCSEGLLAALRYEDLGGAFNEIVISADLYQRQIGDRSRSKADIPKSGDDGWLARISTFAVDCEHRARSGISSTDLALVRSCIIRAMAAIKSIASWVDPRAMEDADIYNAARFVLEDSNVGVQLSTVEAISVVVSRLFDRDVKHSNPLKHILSAELIAKLTSIFARDRRVNSNEEDQMYLLQKKSSELLSGIMNAVVDDPATAVGIDGFHSFFQLLPEVLKNDSLVISIPVLHGWTRLLPSQDQRLIEKASDALAVLMETCTQRLVNFELLSEDFDHPIVTLLYQDFDTMPERHAFLSNYRRYCVSVIDQIARRRPLEALEYIRQQSLPMLMEGPYTRERQLPISSYSKASLPVQQMNAQSTVILSVINSISRSRASRSNKSDATAPDSLSPEQWTTIDASLRQFCIDLCMLRVEDPEVESQIVTILSSIVRNNQLHADIALEVTKHILNARISTDGGNQNFLDSAKNFEALRIVELQKIALVHANILAEAYAELEALVTLLREQYAANPKVVCGCYAFLFIINQRCTVGSSDDRLSRMQDMLLPVSSAWKNPVIEHAVSSFDTFNDYLGLKDLPSFYQQHGFARVEDWTTQQLDEHGQARQTLIRERLDSLPLRITRALLGATTEKLPASSSQYDDACQLWEPLMPIVLPALLQMIGHAQAFSNLLNWSSLPTELQAVIRRTLQDRFWQSGISSESRDEFYARVSGSKSSYEGFASNVRGTIRAVREQAYQILFLFTKFQEQFYGLAGLPDPLANALLDDADSLSANHLNPLISLMTGLTQGCPPHHRIRFLPPLLRKLFVQLDRKIGSEWDATIHVSEQTGDEDDLSEEMRVESVLRQVTYSAVSFVAFLLDGAKPGPTERSTHSNDEPIRPTLADVVLSDTSVLEPLILFCTHALRMRDTRCCTTICKVLIHIMPTFTADTESASQVREFICTEVLKAGITSLNEQYFVDMQRDLAALLAAIIGLYARKSTTPRAILLSLPEMQPNKVDSTIEKLLGQPSSKHQRALVLNLLESVRGVSIHSMGKMSRPEKKEGKNDVQAQYMEVEQRPAIIAGDDAGLDSVAGLFGDS